MLVHRWLNGTLGDPAEMTPLRVVATIVAVCNLSCRHCFWHHDLEEVPVTDWKKQAQLIKSWQAGVDYAGRMVTPKGLVFINACLKAGVKKVRVTDHGYTIFNLPAETLARLDHVSISLDGVEEDHDRQRNKVGAFQKAWSAILKLKNMGYDPIASSCLSPMNIGHWAEFEQILVDYDVPLSVAMISTAEAVVERGVVGFDDKASCWRAFETLLSGVPKIVNLYDLDHVRYLAPILKDLPWVPDQVEGDGLLAKLPSGTEIIYRPQSLLWGAELNLRWDGEFYLPTLNGKTGINARPGFLPAGYAEMVKNLHEQEMGVWSPILGL
ncbi:MAG: Fe-coproporphyrin synthase [Patescibacteria group bacterium]|nr:Fe-coproporphyrin synthase [Patescibacteria group bacterium]